MPPDGSIVFFFKKPMVCTFDNFSTLSVDGEIKMAENH